ncbi:2-amino-4-hydroxy-6-hydroxymethyldihydropteridine diphosphokinase [Acidiphilium acidophilum]|uniref:2-amino-4-hydroxy-6-hydroxymethyldihydropteridine pyrophosphokinase n=1 Tax=Acidiphilium acidophilum TaxID=76588 RepID=A0AAW9DNE7_ACIAO|nr:2-amino-4-hydroxy-6-hydroxymethyldihydropteridine diphosphokinase [Acidiphilium acidophilum]MDX5930568.1 2-amino-4-hydroxy-6-hydroxymethyldihydropteridine diphosphokinase [Acidiphilium acidophilum]
MIYIALGANLAGTKGETPPETCETALVELRELQFMKFVAVSRWYRSRPFPRDDRQPDYCNGVAAFEGSPDPVALMAALHRIEDKLGRTRSVPNAARTLDLDIIDLNGMVRDEGSPVLPHPRAHLREFVLRPLLDIAPDWRDPATGTRGTTLLAALPLYPAGPIVVW